MGLHVTFLCDICDHEHVVSLVTVGQPLKEPAGWRLIGARTLLCPRHDIVEREPTPVAITQAAPVADEEAG